jgi:hypothetical protein
LTTAIGSALTLPSSVNVLPASLKQNEILRWVNRAGLVASAAVFIIFFGITGTTKINLNSLNSEIRPMQEEKDQLSYVQGDHTILNENKNNVEQQLDNLSYDTEYFNRILAINRFLSYYTPKEIRIDQLNFQEGWEIQAYKKIGRDLVKVVRKEDEHLRIVRIEGKVKSNPALLDRHFNNFLTTLEGSGLFQDVEVMSEASQVYMGSDNLQFQLKCII